MPALIIGHFDRAWVGKARQKGQRPGISLVFEAFADGAAGVVSLGVCSFSCCSCCSGSDSAMISGSTGGWGGGCAGASAGRVKDGSLSFLAIRARRLSRADCNTCCFSGESSASSEDSLTNAYARDHRFETYLQVLCHSGYHFSSSSLPTVWLYIGSATNSCNKNKSYNCISLGLRLVIPFPSRRQHHLKR